MFKEPAAPVPHGKKRTGLSRLILPFKTSRVPSETVSDAEVEDLFKDAQAEEPMQFEAKDSARGHRVAQMKFEEQRETAERLRHEDETESAAAVERLRAQMGLKDKVPLTKAKKQHLAVTPEELEELRRLSESLESQRRASPDQPRAQ